MLRFVTVSPNINKYIDGFLRLCVALNKSQEYYIISFYLGESKDRSILSRESFSLYCFDFKSISFLIQYHSMSSFSLRNMTHLSPKFGIYRKIFIKNIKITQNFRKRTQKLFEEHTGLPTVFDSDLHSSEYNKKF